MAANEAPDSRYDAAEAQFISAVRAGHDREVLRELAAEVAAAAVEWQSTAYAAFFAERERSTEASRPVIELEIEAERAELLSGLWADLSAALTE